MLIRVGYDIIFEHPAPTPMIAMLYLHPSWNLAIRRGDYLLVEPSAPISEYTDVFGKVYQERVGVCRDFTHLAVTFCRCLNIPARYCTGYLGDVGVPSSPDSMDFSAWFEAYLGGRWYAFDPRNHTPRIGRVLMAYGHAAAEVALLTSFGPSRLDRFTVWTDEVGEEALAPV